jgi:hypothetical protein
LAVVRLFLRTSPRRDSRPRHRCAVQSEFARVYYVRTDIYLENWFARRCTRPESHQQFSPRRPYRTNVAARKDDPRRPERQCKGGGSARNMSADLRGTRHFDRRPRSCCLAGEWHQKTILLSQPSHPDYLLSVVRRQLIRCGKKARNLVLMDGVGSAKARCSV